MTENKSNKNGLKLSFVYSSIKDNHRFFFFVPMISLVIHIFLYVRVCVYIPRLLVCVWLLFSEVKSNILLLASIHTHCVV